jgi:KTSC domain
VPPTGWQPCSSTAVAAYRFLPDRGLLQLRFRDGQTAYDYPCDGRLFERFLAAGSKGRFVNDVLRPHADALQNVRTPAEAGVLEELRD